jgi:multiple sugar transport system permease protein
MLSAPPSTSERRSRLRECLTALAFISPNLTLFGVFTLVPALFTLALAFFRWDPFVAPTFVGFDNFNQLLLDGRFWYYLLNTLVFMLGLPLSMAGSLLLAVMLSKKLRGVIAYRTVFYLPTITNGVALFLLWRVMYNKESGLINACILPLLRLAGVHGADGELITARGMPDWLMDSWTIFGYPIYLAKPALIFMGVWASIGGTNMLLYLAALVGVPPELYEAAEIDGASRWRRFLDVTWPMIAPTTFFIAVIGVIGSLQGGFEIAYMMTGGGPEQSTVTIGYYIFAKAFIDYQFGYAAAISFLLFMIIMVVTALGWRFGSKAADNQ